MAPPTRVPRDRSSPYDLVPYQGTVVAIANPHHLDLCSRWDGGPCGRHNAFRLVELGCGDGANLLPIAFYHPESTLIGIDSSGGEVERARDGAKRVGLDNLRLMHEDVRDLDPAAFAPCDFVIAHGLYSWVDEDARSAILRFCQRSLTPPGLAYVSYNAQPGWATRHLVRETLLRDPSVRDAGVPEKAGRAIEVAARLLDALSSRSDAYALNLAGELARVRDGKPSYVLHEYLAETNDGFWVRDFAERARAHGLAYVGDAQVHRWCGPVPAPDRAAPDRDPLVDVETQDLLGHRHFRASILCRQDAPRTPSSRREILEQVSIATSLAAEADPFDLREGAVEHFQRPAGPEVSLDASITKAAVVALAAEWPRGMRLEELHGRAATLLSAHGCTIPGDARSVLSRELITLFEAGQVDLRSYEPAFSSMVPESPEAHALARHEAGHLESLTAPHHLPVPLEPEARALVRSLDGSRSQEDLRRDFGSDLVERTLPVLRRWGFLSAPGVRRPVSRRPSSDRDTRRREGEPEAKTARPW